MSLVTLYFHNQSIVSTFLRDAVGHGQHFGGHVRQDRAFGLELVPVLDHVGVVHVEAHGLFVEIGLADE